MKNINKIIVTLLLVLSSSFLSAQDKPQNLQDIEGTWKYHDEQTEFYLILLYKQVEVRKGKIENKLIGFSKLIHNGEIVYNRLSNKDFFIAKSIYKSVELYNTNRPDTESTSPDFNLYSSSLGLRGTYSAMNYTTMVNIEGECDENTLTLHFSKPSDGIFTPDIIQKREAMYANHIPELPSTWVLERVTEDEIKE